MESSIVHKSFLEFHSKMALQDSPKQLRKMGTLNVKKNMTQYGTTQLVWDPESKHYLKRQYLQPFQIFTGAAELQTLVIVGESFL